VNGATTCQIDTDEWKRRFKAHIMRRLEPFKPEGGKGPGWTEAQAERAADAELESADFADIYSGYEDRPEASADESLSYWEGGA
jgi:hypothetical protein